MNLERTVAVARFALRNGGTGPLSTGEALTAALVLNRHDWLTAMVYTIAEALDRIDSDTLQHLRAAERIICREQEQTAIAAQPAQGVDLEALSVLIAHAEGKIQHHNNGLCPDRLEGHDIRDPACTVCKALIDSKAVRNG